MKKQKDLFKNDKEERCLDLKKQIYEELTKPFREACLRFVDLRHDSSFRNELEDLQDLFDYAKYHHGNYSNYEESHFNIIKNGFTTFWNNRKYNGGWR